MISAPFGSLALQLFPDLRIVTKISPGSDTQEKVSPSLCGDNITSNKTPQLKQVLNHRDKTYPCYNQSVFTQGELSIRYLTNMNS